MEKFFDQIEHDSRDPNPWLALYLDQSTPLPAKTKEALLKCLSSKSRQFLLPIVRPLARTSIILIQLLRTIIPNSFASSRFLHYLIFVGLKYFVSPHANYLILRHFHMGSEILSFIRKNCGVGSEISQHPLKPFKLEDVKEHLFLQHDLNLFNFVIELNTHLKNESKTLQKINAPDFSMITDDPIPFDTFRNRWTNFIDVETAIELYTPMYQLLLTDNDFWRATNSLQLDETIGIYISKILGTSESMWLINNKHPLVPLSTLRAGYRLMLHGVASETLHAHLVELKKRANQSFA